MALQSNPKKFISERMKRWVINQLREDIINSSQPKDGVMIDTVDNNSAYITFKSNGHYRTFKIQVSEIRKD